MSIQVSKVHTFTGHRDSVYALQPGPEPHLFFSAAGDGMVVMWNLQTPGDGELIAKVPNSVYSLLHLPKKRILVVGQNFSGIHLIDCQNKKEVASLALTSSSIFDIQFNNGDLVVATGDGVVVIVDLETWTIKKRIASSGKSARAIGINAPRSEFAVGYSDHSIRIFDLNSCELKQEIKAHENSVFSVCYSPDFEYLFSVSRDARLKVWSVEHGYNLVDEIVAHMYAINHIAFSPDGKNFATASMDKSIKVWDTASRKLLKVIDKGRHAGHGTSVNKLLWTSFNNQLVSASDDRTISAWDLLFL